MEGRDLTLAGAEKSRYGYNGMEKDDEVKGAGNSYTTEFRQLDPRLGRWLSIDPVFKPDQSPYISMSNNPITRIDPNGDDDYFNADGTLNKEKSTKTGSNIYVQSGDKFVLLTELNLNAPTHEYLAKQVVNHYAKQLGISGTVGLLSAVKSKKSEENPASTFKKKVSINISSTGWLWGGKKMNSMLHDANNLKNVLYHEKLHQDQQKQGKEFSDETFEGLLNHSKIYLAQMDHETFENTTKDWKSGQIGSLANYFERSLNESLKSFDVEEDAKKITDLIKTFNETTGKKYGYSISAQQTSIGGELMWSVDAKKTKK